MKAALIDLDGTLLDTAPDLAAAANATLRDLRLPDIDSAMIRDYVGKGIAHLMRKSLEAALGRTPDPALFELAQAIFAGHYERVNGAAATPFPGVVEGLEAMRAHGLKLACVTNKVARFTQPLLAKTRLDGYFDAIVTSDMAGARKPDPAVFLYACRALGVTPSEAGVIGDSDNDGEAARAAGCLFLLVPYGYREGRSIAEVKNDGVVDSLLDAVRLLRN
jgi:phosphoglycolate phosphatase